MGKNCTKKRITKIEKTLSFLFFLFSHTCAPLSLSLPFSNTSTSPLLLFVSHEGETRLRVLGNL